MSIFDTAISQTDGIAVISISGIISFNRESNVLGIIKFGARDIIELLKKAEKSDAVKGVVLRLNSPGGTMGASQEIYEAVKRVKKAKKIIVVSMGDMAASGAYYISSIADIIVANPGTITGSIGVYIGNLNFTRLLEKIGIKMNMIKSDKHKDILSPYRDLSGEELKILNDTIKKVFKQFYNVVVTNRNDRLNEEHYDKIFDGRFFSGEEALEYGVVDKLGGLETAIETAGELAGIKGPPGIIDLEGKKKYLKFFLNSFMNDNNIFSNLNKTDYIPLKFMNNNIHH